MSKTILRIDSSARTTDSSTRALTDQLVTRLRAAHPNTGITVRDLNDGMPFVTADWVDANFTPAENRTDQQKKTLAFSDQLVDELKQADTIVIGMPIYNFGPPASLKAWIDMIARARLTFKYTDNGPVGLLDNKKAYVVVASGGTPIGSDIDFATTYVKHALAFVGISDVTVVEATEQMMKGEDAVKAAEDTIRALTIAQTDPVAA